MEAKTGPYRFSGTAPLHAEDQNHIWVIINSQGQRSLIIDKCYHAAIKLQLIKSHAGNQWAQRDQEERAGQADDQRAIASRLK